MNEIKSKMMKNIGIIWLFLVLVLAGCRKDVNTTTTTEHIPEPYIIEGYEPTVLNVTTSLRGLVQDENQQAVEGALVKMGTLTTTTNKFGHFFFNNTTMNSKGQLVTVESPGYFPGSRRFFPTANTENRLTVELLDKNFNQSFNSSLGSDSIFLSGGGSLDFESNSIVDANGNLYTGTVNVAAKWLDPSAQQTLNQMPGNLQGVNTNNQEVALGTYGMVVVELEDNNGEPLNLADDKTATMTVPVPVSLLGTAPAQIPLWSYNESYGLWQEESSASLTNGSYVGEVSHFSFWNYDWPYEAVYFDARLVDVNGNPVTGLGVSINSQNIGTGYSNSAIDGTVGGLIPAGETLTLEVHDNNNCGVIFSKQIGPYSSDISYGDISVAGSNIITTTILGTVNCNGGLLNDAVITASRNGAIDYYYTNNAQFQFSYLDCLTASNVEVKAYDLASGMEGPVHQVQGGISTNLGVIEACDTAIQSYISLTVDGVTQEYVMPFASFISTFTDISYTGTSDSLSINIPGTTAGDYSMTIGTNFTVWDFVNQWQFTESISGASPFDTFILTELNPSKVEGSFSGTMENTYISPTTTHQVDCYFHIVP